MAALFKPKLAVELGLENKKFLKGMDQSVGKLKSTGGKMGSAFGTAFSTAAGFLIANVIGKALAVVRSQFGATVFAASDLSETISKTRNVFGATANDMLSWAKNSETALGLSEQAALDAGSTFGGMAKGAGLTGKAVNVFSKDLVQAGADLGSFFNVDPAQVLEDLRSGLAGESEPLRKYNIFINEAAVKTEAYRLGIAKTGEELTEQQKILARNSLILKGVGDAQGDFAETSGGLANGLRIAQAWVQSFRVWLGNKLLPIVNKGVQLFNRFAGRISRLTKDGAKPLTAVLKSLHVVLNQVFGRKIGHLIFETIREGIRIFRLFKQVVTGDFAGAFKTLQRIGRDGVRAIKGLWDLIDWGAIGKTLLNGVATAWAFALGTLLPWLWDQAKKLVGRLWDAIDWDAVGGAIWGGLKSAWTFVTDTAPGWLAEKGLALLKALWAIDWVAIGADIWAGIKVAVGAAVDLGIGAAVDLGNQGLSLFKGLWTLDWGQVGTDLWNGLWTGVQKVKELGALTLDAVVELGGDLGEITADFGAWLKRATGWGDEGKTVNLGKVTINADANINFDTGGGGGGGLKGFLSGTWEFAKDLPMTVMRALGSLQGWGEAAGEFAAGLVNKLMGALVEKIRLTPVETIAKIAAAIGGVFLAVFSLPLLPAIALQAVIGSVIDGFARGFLSAEATALKDAVGGWAQRSIIDPVKRILGIHSPSSVFKGIGSDIIAGLMQPFDMGRIGNFFFSVGRAIVGGIINGMNSLWAQFVAKISALIIQATSIKVRLGIASPSKFTKSVFANYMLGAIKGVESGMPRFARAIGQVSATAGGVGGTVRLAPIPAVAGAGTGRGGGAIGGGGSVWNFNAPITVNANNPQEFARAMIAAKNRRRAGRAR